MQNNIERKQIAAQKA